MVVILINLVDLIVSVKLFKLVELSNRIMDMLRLELEGL